MSYWMASPRISTRNLAALPPPSRMRQICKALALLDATYSETYRVYTYELRPAGESAYMQSHSGDMFAIFFDSHGAVIRGFELYSALGHSDRRPSDDELFEGLPESLFPGARGDYADGGDDLTFVLWCGNGDRWHTGRLTFDEDEAGDVDGSETCLWMLADDRSTFLEYAHHITECVGRMHDDDVAALFDMQPITTEMIVRLNASADVDSVLALAAEIGWPGAETSSRRCVPG